jgi:hypothetical protein
VIGVVEKRVLDGVHRRSLFDGHLMIYTGFERLSDWFLFLYVCFGLRDWDYLLLRWGRTMLFEYFLN